MNIYLDIDGVLITKDNKPANFVTEFLKYITERHSVYWLTTHCRGGENRALFHLQDKLLEEATQYLYKIKSTDWSTLKTEAIDFTKDFIWFDDYILGVEKNILIKNNVLDSFIEVNLKNNPKHLKEFLNKYNL